MGRILLLLFLIATTSVPTIALARDRYRLVVHVDKAPYSLTRGQAIDLVNSAIPEVQSRLGITLRLRRVSSINKAYSTDINQVLTSFGRWYKYVGNKHRGNVRKTIHVVITGPLLGNGNRYIAGYASKTCSAGKQLSVVVINAQMFNQYGESRQTHNIASLVHELGHVLGSPHVTSESLMNPNALALVRDNYIPPFDNLSFLSIMQCQGL